MNSTPPGVTSGAKPRARPLEPADRAAWERLWRGYLTFYEQPLSEAITERTWARLMDPQFDLHGLCVHDGDRMAGLCHYLFHPSTWADGPYCYLEDLFVDADARVGGCGRALIEAVYAAADDRKAERVYWATQEGNETARKLYDRIARLTPFVQYAR
ncbi:N-acetyltransferase family protein [Microbaculum sp. FT89]|uniref:GNAT family N-acetyltransferase n=1 Tax=Microbaculum sp. FT89 TaxID=3447298 RepID=UPI003F52D0D6